jgi:hypothetical protein
MGRKSIPTDFTEEETRSRFEAALRGARMVGHKPQSEMKLGKPRAKPSGRKKGRAKKSKAT